MNLNIDNSSDKITKFTQNTVYVLFFLLFCRLISMYFVPLNDSTEARYGEIARIMLETGNWITPMHQYGVPFWAKPPLSTWSSALSMKLFGVNEFAARLPALLFSIGILWLIFALAKKQSGKNVAMMSVLILASSLYFFLDAGTVMTDPSLLFCTTLIFVSFWRAVAQKDILMSYMFFVALGLGLLAKGPVAIVITGMPLFVWIILNRKWNDLWHNLPWIKGSLLMMVIALPWYLLAEERTPGFINYFIVGEHIKRFLQPGWTGDKYGFAHVAPYGMIWVYAFIGICPWSVAAVVWLCRHAKSVPSLFLDKDGWTSYLILCTIVPLLFFTFARNIIYPYVFPIIPTFSLLFSEIANRSELIHKYKRKIIPCSCLFGVLFLCLTALFLFKPELIAKSQNRVVDLVNKQHPSLQNQLVYWSYKTEYSAQFYSKGHAKATLDSHVLCDLLAHNKDGFVVVDSEEQRLIPNYILSKLTNIGVVSVLKKRFSVLKADEILCSS